MGLPVIEQPLFEITIPSTEKKAKIRPFTVKEEKILLLAQESDDFDQVILSIKQIVGNCLQEIDVDDLAMFDIEYLLLNIRARSVNNIIEFKIRDPESEEEIDVSLDINNIEIKRNEEHDKNIEVDSNVSLIMKYPSLDQAKMAMSAPEGKENEAMFNVMIQCIDKVVNGDEVLTLKDFSDEEIQDFVESMSSTTLKKIENFYQTMPTLKFEIPYKLKDGTKKTFNVEGTETFFI